MIGAVVVISCAAYLLTRLVLALSFSPSLFESPAKALTVFALGSVYDLSVACWAALPFAAAAMLWPRRRIATSGGRRVFKCALAILLFAAAWTAVSEWLFWDEFSTRFNFIAVDYLIYTREVVGNIRQSYPVELLIGAMVVFTWLATRLLWPWLQTHLLAAGHETRGLPSRLGSLAMIAVAVLALHQFTNRNWRESLQVPAHRELAANGPYEFVAAFVANSLTWNTFYLSLSEPEVWDELRQDRMRQKAEQAGAQQLSDPPLTMIATHRKPIRPNVVLVSMESMSADFMQTFGNPRNLTPTLDRLAGESLFFARTYASGTRTVRGLEALTLSVPPTPGNGFVRRPGNEQMFSVGGVFKDHGYRPMYIYGGYGYFDNMNGFYSGIGYDVVDRTAVPSDQIHHETIWGIADEDLFTQALTTLDQHQKQHPDQPFFAHVMTTSNHRPYTYPNGRIDIPSKTGRDGGVKYADWSLGNFIERARQKSWFDNTVFVIVADHQASSAGKRDLPIHRYHIPMMFYAPKLIEPKRVDRLTAQIDMAPTLFGLLGWSYESRFFGRDMLTAAPASDRAFISTYQKLGYIEGDRIAILEPGKRARIETIQWDNHETEQVLQVDEQTDMSTVAAADRAMIRRAIAFYQGTELAFRDGKLKHPPASGKLAKAP